MENKKDKEVRITNVRPEVRKDLKEIAKNKGIPLANFLRLELTRIRDMNSSYIRRNSID